MMKKYFALGIIALLFVSTCCIFSGQYALYGCFWWECAPERDFYVLDWEIPVDLFPKGATIDHISPPTDGHGEIGGGSQHIHMGYDGATYSIYRFPSTRKAIVDFNRIKKGMFDPETGILWQPPDKSTFSSSTADDLYIACGYWSKRYRCEMTARYQEYVIFFNADINDKMTFTQFEKILFYLDEQISSRLYP